MAAGVTIVAKCTEIARIEVESANSHHDEVDGGDDQHGRVERESASPLCTLLTFGLVF